MVLWVIAGYFFVCWVTGIDVCAGVESLVSCWVTGGLALVFFSA